MSAYSSDTLYRIALTPEQIRLLDWLEDNDFLGDINTEYDDEVEVEII
jgi:hypothetical protein